MGLFFFFFVCDWTKIFGYLHAEHMKIVEMDL